MPADAVLDASVAAKLFISEPGSAEARRFVRAGARLIAPDLVLVELTHVAIKRLRVGDIPRDLAERMVAGAPALFSDLVAPDSLVDRAFVLAADHRLSAYDATYLALAEQRGCELVTADQRLIARATAAGLGAMVRAP